MGVFITFEGPEGSGKSTQIELLSKALADRGPVLVREPGGTDIGERIRDILLNGNFDIDAEAEMYLFMAARRQLIAEVIEPALAAGHIVIADRYHESTLAYQGGGRNIATTWPGSFPRPDITFLLKLDAVHGRARQSAARKNADRMERESMEFHDRVAAEYDRLAVSDPKRIVTLDASKPASEVHASVLARLKPLLAATKV